MVERREEREEEEKEGLTFCLSKSPDEMGVSLK